MSTNSAADNSSAALFLHAGALGDFVLTLWVVAAFRVRFPDAPVDVAARSPLARWAAECGAVRRAMDLEDLPLHQLYAAAPDLDSLRTALNPYAQVVSFLGGKDQPYAAALRALVPGRCVCLDPAPTAETLRRGIHISEQWSADLAAAGLPLSTVRRFGVAIPPVRREAVRAVLDALVEPPTTRVTLIHPGSGGKAKCCPVERLEETIDGLRRSSVQPLWMIGPVERDWCGAGFCERLRRSAPVIEEPYLGRAADLLDAAALFIGNDAGMTHLAAALGTPTIALFGPTDPQVWRPLGPHVCVVRFSESERDVSSRIVAAVDELLRRTLDPPPP